MGGKQVDMPHEPHSCSMKKSGYVDSILDYARYHIQYYGMGMSAVARHAVDRLVIHWVEIFQVDDCIILGSPS